jgi:hypothetical protein
MNVTRFALAGTLAASLAPAIAGAHGFVGERFFPATILTDDPFVADEMSLPTFTVNPPGPDGSKEIDLETDISKSLWPGVGITISDQWEHLQPKGSSVATGLGTLPR